MIERRRVLAGMAAFTVTGACSRPAEVVGLDNPAFPALSTPGVRAVKVFVATTRAPSAVEGRMFSSRRADRLSLGSVNVTVPPEREPGTFARTNRAPPDPRSQFAAVDPVRYPSSRAFISEIDTQLMQAAGAGTSRDILLFIHGFNTRLSDAVLRVGQFVADSGFQGVPVLFSWASAGRLTEYIYDLNSALAARPYLEQTSAILQQTKARGFDVFAHSMGSLLVMETIVQSDLRGNLARSGRLRNVILAAPDIDLDLFRSQLRQIRQDVGNIFVFVDQEDRTLGVSELISSGTRVGRASGPELEALGITVIDITGSTGTGVLVHRRYANSPDIVRLIGQTFDSYGYSEARPDTLVLTLEDLLP